VKLQRAPIPAGETERLAFAFPGKAKGDEPIALLSLASRGDMKFGLPSCAANRELFLRGAGIEPERALAIDLAHTREIIAPSRGDDAAAMARDLGGADGILLDDPELAATVTVADCMPIWILDRGSGSFGVLHSGWRGTGILESAVNFLVERRGARPSALAVILGPAIGSCCYAVSEERASEFAAEFGAAAAPRREGSAFLDLRAANLALAERIGVGHLLSIEACTSCEERLGSFRRQGAASFTRMLAVCGTSSVEPDIPEAESRPRGLRA
jgi:polyphenol oxidase